MNCPREAGRPLQPLNHAIKPNASLPSCPTPINLGIESIRSVNLKQYYRIEDPLGFGLSVSRCVCLFVCYKNTIFWLIHLLILRFFIDLVLIDNKNSNSSYRAETIMGFGYSKRVCTITNTNIYFQIIH